MKKRAVFLDRDGTINDDPGYPSLYNEIKIYPSSFEAVRTLNAAGFLTVVVTNQSGVGRGLFTEGDLRLLHQKIRASFLRHEARIDAFYYCPHFELSRDPLYRQGCTCRKPGPGMALRAAVDLEIDLKRSYVIGDKMEDIVFGLNIQATPVLVLTGNGREALSKLKELGVEPSHVASEILDAVRWILEEEENRVKA